MAVDRFTRFKILRAVWARAKALIAALGMPHEREARHRAFRWQHIQVAERYTRDGIVRGTGDPDSYVRLQSLDLRPVVEMRRPDVRSTPTSPAQDPAPFWPAQWAAQHQQWERQRQQVEALQRQVQDAQRRGR